MVARLVLEEVRTAITQAGRPGWLSFTGSLFKPGPSDTYGQAGISFTESSWVPSPDLGPESEGPLLREDQLEDSHDRADQTWLVWESWKIVY